MTEKKHLNDVPLNTRANRKMVRDIIDQNKEKLEEAYNGFKEQTGYAGSFDEWMIGNQCVNMNLLNDLKEIDSIYDDDEYVEQFSKYQQEKAKELWKKDHEEGITDLVFADWVEQEFGIPLSQLGVKEAVSDIEEDKESFVEKQNAVFLIGFDGTIVENRYPEIGPESPYAIDTIKALIKNGHTVIIYSDRINYPEENNKLGKFFKDRDVGVYGFTDEYSDNGYIEDYSIDMPDTSAEIRKSQYVDHFIHVNNFGTGKIKLSENDDDPLTLYWGDIVYHLKRHGYLTEDDFQQMLKNIQQKTNELSGE